MKTIKKLIAVFILAAMILALLPVGMMTVSAYSAHTKTEAVNWMKARADESWWDDVDGVYGCQCVDLIKAYYSYLGAAPVYGHAYAYCSNELPDGWYRDRTPSAGSIIAFPQTDVMWYGHVGLVYAVSGSTVYTVETNSRVTDATSGLQGYSNARYETRISPDAYYIHPDFKPEEVTVTVSFNANGGTVSDSSKAVTVGKTYGTLPTPTREGFSFSGWYNAKSGGSKVASSTTVSNSSNHTLYAHWTPTGNGSWTAWSSWSTTAVSETDTRQVETKSETIGYNMVTITCGNSSGTRCYLPYMQSGYTKRAGPYEEYWDTSKMSSSTAYAPGAWFDYWDGTAVDGYIVGPGNAYVAADGYLPYYISSTATRTLYRYRDWVTHTHSYTAVVTAPTCTERGYTTHTCSCGDSYVDTYVAALGHNWGNWRATTQATCTKAGEESRTCGYCGAVETRVIDPLGHDYEIEVTEPTCTEAGHNEYVCCRCGYSYTVAGDPARGHRWDSGTITVAPTTTKPGIVTYTCTVCGETRMEILPALGDRIKGDADGDGEITVADALVALRIASKLVTEAVERIAVCDTDGDGEITVADALTILRVAAKLANSL